MNLEKTLRYLENGFVMNPQEQSDAAKYIRQLQESNEVLKASMIEFAETIFRLKRELSERSEK